MRTPARRGRAPERRRAVHPVRRVLPLADPRRRRRSSTTACPGLLWVGAVGVVGARSPAGSSSSRGRSSPRTGSRKLAPVPVGLVVVARRRDGRRVEPDRRLQPPLGAQPGSLRRRPRQPRPGALAARGARDLAGRRVRRHRRRRPGRRRALLPRRSDRARRRSSSACSATVASATGRCRPCSSRWPASGSSRRCSSPYIAAKALAILAPVVIAIALRGTLAARGGRRWRSASSSSSRPRALASWSSARRRSAPTPRRRSSSRCAALVARRAGPLPRPRRLHRLGAARLGRDHRDRHQLLRRRGRRGRGSRRGRGRREVRRRRRLPDDAR